LLHDHAIEIAAVDSAYFCVILTIVSADVKFVKRPEPLKHERLLRGAIWSARQTLSNDGQ